MAILKGVKDRIDVKVTAEVEGDNGTTIKVPFVVTYKKPPESVAKQLKKSLYPGVDADGIPLESDVTDHELMEEYLLGWSKVPTSTGEEFEFTPENVEAMLEAREYRLALVRGFLSVLLGRDAIRKNSPKRGGRGG